MPQASPLLTVWVGMTLEFSSFYLQFSSVGITDVHAMLGISPKGFTHLMLVIYQLLHLQPVLNFLRTQSFKDYTFCIISGDRSKASRMLQSVSRCSQMRVGDKRWSSVVEHFSGSTGLGFNLYHSCRLEVGEDDNDNRTIKEIIGLGV